MALNIVPWNTLAAATFLLCLLSHSSRIYATRLLDHASISESNKQQQAGELFSVLAVNPPKLVNKQKLERQLRENPVALHIFGDSYVDNGNRNESDEDAWCWREPYGRTWPGKPTGRCSDGKVLSDWLATLYNLSLPVPYKELISSDNDREEKAKAAFRGVNFAVAGSGVFKDFGYKTLNGQVAWFQGLVNDGIIESNSLQDSFFLVSTSSNDYFNFVSEGRWSIFIPTYIAKVVTALTLGIEKLYAIGARKFVVTNVMPLGCLPAVKTVVNVTDCYTLGNAISYIHNTALSQLITILRFKLCDATIVLADMNKAFSDIGVSHDIFGFYNSFLACCDPAGGGISCGWHNVTYDVCAKPEHSFFWDSFHLTSKGHQTVAKLFYDGDGYTDPPPNLSAVL